MFANLLGNSMVTDPIGDFLVRLQNASRVGHTHVRAPYSMMKEAVAKVLHQEGYIAEISKHKKGEPLEVALSYKNNQPVITGYKRVSKPSRRMYLGVRDLHPIKRGHGLQVLSTPGGVMSSKEAKTKRLGGEVLFEIW